MRQPATKKCLSYCRRMITSKKWETNKRIPTATKVSKILNISRSTVTRCFRFLEQEGKLNNYGSLGYFLLSKPQIKKLKQSKQLLMLDNISRDLEIADVLNNENGVIINNYAVHIKNSKLKILDTKSLYKLVINKTELQEIFRKGPINLHSVLNNKETKKKYKRQSEIIDVLLILLQYKDEIGLSNILY